MLLMSLWIPIISRAAGTSGYAGTSSMKRGHVPIRTCKGCGQRSSVLDLIRLVVFGGVVTEDFDRVLPGRGVYCCRNAECRSRLLEKNKKQLKRTSRRS
ncbi:MAG: DUF448 domain-containing protein [Candidatus Electrothrix sp. AR3]|nr:DUF448 domain-containing protein [Candidatus Electrothrix sp. AR3]